MRILAILAAMCLLATPSAADVEPIPIPAAYESAFALDVNASEEVVGSYFVPGTGTVTYFYSPRTGFRSISREGVSSLRVTGLNDNGDMAGTFIDAEGHPHGFVWSADDEFRVIDVPGRDTFVTDVTEDGVVIGYYYHARDDFNRISGFIMRAGVIEVLDNPWGLPITLPQGIADDGTLVGYYRDVVDFTGDNPLWGFVIRNGEWEQLQLPDTIDTVPTGITPDGRVIVGFVRFSDERHGFILQNGNIEVLGPSTRIEGINRAGVMVGESTLPNDSREFNAVYFGLTEAFPLRVTTPNDPSRWGLHTRQRLAWTYEGDAPQFQIDISRDGGDTWDFLSVVPNRVGGSQNFVWTVTEPATPNARLRVTAIGDEEAMDVNDADIRIAPAAVDILRPSGKTTVTLGSTQAIFFRHNLGARKPIAIDVSDDGGGTWRTIAQSTRTRGSTTSSYPWVVDVMPTTRARVRVRALDGTGASDVSDPFEVVAGIVRDVSGTIRVNFEEDGILALTSQHFAVSSNFPSFFPCGPTADEPCFQGQEVNMSHELIDAAEVTIGSRHFDSGDVSISLEVKPITPREGVVTAPFTMTGKVRGLAEDEVTPLAEVEFTGRGTMRVEFCGRDCFDSDSQQVLFVSIFLRIDEGTQRIVKLPR